MAIWGEDANGQLGREKEHPEKYHKIIGPYTKQTTLEKGNGISLAETCRKTQMIPMNTWKRVKTTKQKNKNKNKPKPNRRAKKSTSRLPHYMDQSRRQHHQANRLCTYKPKI